jgi:hypothetical protein
MTLGAAVPSIATGAQLSGALGVGFRGSVEIEASMAACRTAGHSTADRPHAMRARYCATGALHVLYVWTSTYISIDRLH